MDRRTEQNIQRDLEDRGVPVALATAVSGRLAPHVEGIAESAYEGLLTGVATAYAVHRDGFEGTRKTPRDLAEMQQLMSDFGDELRKLDEALEVLSAYLVRMRSQTQGTPSTLH